MEMTGSDPTVDGLVTSINRGEIDLQPEFQRGEVWSEQKQERLIDTILRGWHIPPIHLVAVPGKAALEVLDGQQRLRAIVRFINNELPINGYIEPYDEKIQTLNGLFFGELEDAELVRQIRNFPIRQFVLKHYHPAEPAELFYRLNQPALLTGAEKRNAFFGPARSAVKDIVDVMESKGIDRDFIGFSNSRMAYEDVISRLALMVERRTALRKVTANDLTDWYRQSEAPSPASLGLLYGAIDTFSASRDFVTGKVRFNKATFLSWLWFSVELMAWFPREASPRLFAQVLNRFESLRTEELKPPLLDTLLTIYRDRSSARVSDVSSVLLRECIIWFVAADEQYAALEAIDKRPTYFIDLIGLGHRIGVESSFIDDIAAEFVEQHLHQHVI